MKNFGEYSKERKRRRIVLLIIKERKYKAIYTVAKTNP